MKNERYILTIHNETIFKEVDIAPEEPVVKIGTLQDCSVRMKQDVFGMPICLTMALEDNGWRIICGSGLIASSQSVSGSREIRLKNGDMLKIHKSATMEVLFYLSFSYDYTVSAHDFDTIVDIRSVNSFIIGNAANAQIRLSSGYVGSENIVLYRDNAGKLVLNPENAPESATLSGVRLIEKAVVHDYDFIGIADYSFYYKNGVLYTARRSDMDIIGIPSQLLREETPAFNYPKFNRSPRMKYAPDERPIEVLPPDKKPEKPRQNLALQLFPALLMIAVTVITRSGIIQGLNTGSPMFLVFSLSSMSVGLITTISTFIYSRVSYKKALEEWQRDYSAYIESKRQEIEAAQNSERASLVDTYPSPEKERSFVKEFSGRLFERSPQDEDFLHVRVGMGAVPALRKITCESRESIKADNELVDIPQQLCREYAQIKDVPVRVHLKESGSVGVVGSEEQRYEFFKSMLLDVCVEHCFDDVQIVVALPHKDRAKYDWIKWLPHLKDSGGGMRGIVCDDESRDNVFEYLYSLLVFRNSQPRENIEAFLPHYVVFVLEEHNIKTHPLSQYTARASELGFSFVYFKEYKESLPKECEELVFLDQNGGTLRRSENKEYACRFVSEQIKDDSLRFVVDRLAPVYTEKIELSSRLTSNITLFELLNIISPDNLDLIDRWKKSAVQKSLAAALGVDTKGNIVSLDLHEKAHGPHGLVAGTTGSGKSEIMQSYILSAAVTYHPYELAFVIIDFKGGGMANQFDNLPHLVGKITDIDDHEINRSLLSIHAELEKRKRLFAQYEVNHIDQYIGKFRSGEAQTALPHLVLIVDEFAELKAEQPEFMKELISTARVGRSLGIHLILATQKPSGQVSEQIWSNSRFKLCLKVATKEDSNEVLKSPLAAELREPGRAYLQVGNNEVFTLFQSAYSGASAESDKNGNIREFKISRVSFTGKRTPVYERKAHFTSGGKKLTQLKAIVDYVGSYCEQHKIQRLPSICLPPLPEILDYVPAAAAKGTCVRIGKYDDPANQLQPDVMLDFSAGNVMVIGSAQSGKTMLLQTILRGIAEQYAPGRASVYILDFASKVLKIYERMNHVGAVLTDSDEEKIRNFFKMMLAEIERRKELFLNNQITSYESWLESFPDKPLPNIIIMIDNFLAFKETFQEYEDAMLNICREGLSLGVTVVATAKQTSGLSYRYLSNFAVRLAFNCTDRSEYTTIFDRCRIVPRVLPGRGLVSVNKEIYEFQSYLTFDGIIGQTDSEIRRNENKRMDQVRDFIESVSARYGKEKAAAVPSIPTLLTTDYWNESNFTAKSFFHIPVGLTYSDIETVAVDLASVGSIGIYGREKFGKSNLIRRIMNCLWDHLFEINCEAYLIDSYDRQLTEEFRTYGFVNGLTMDCDELEDILQRFENAAAERMDILRSGGDLEDQPLMLCIIQNKRVFEAGAVSKAVTDKLKKLLSDSRRIKMCFIFSDLENSGEYSPPEMVKLTKDLGCYFLLDDIANVKLFGTSKFTPAELKKFKKPLALGDGYYYDQRGGLAKIKLVKTERRD